MRSVLGWVLNEACRIFNLVEEGRQGKRKQNGWRSSKESACNKNNSLGLHYTPVSSTGSEWIWSFFREGGRKFGSLCFGYSLIAVFSGKGIILRGIQM